MSHKILVAQGGGPTAVINQSLVGVALEARRFPDVTPCLWRAAGRARHRQRRSRRSRPGDGRQSRGGRRDARRRARLDPRQARPQILPGDLQGPEGPRDRHVLLYRRQRIPPTPCASSPRRRRRPTTGCARSISPRPSTTISSASITRRAIRRRRVSSRRPSPAPISTIWRCKGVYCAVVMGRHAGFLTAASALARKYPDDGPHLIYLPERTFVVDKFLADVKDDVRASRPLHHRRLRGRPRREGRGDHHQAHGQSGEGRAWQRPAFRHRRARRPPVRGGEGQARDQARARRHVRLSAALVRRLREQGRPARGARGRREGGAICASRARATARSRSAASATMRSTIR